MRDFSRKLTCGAIAALLLMTAAAPAEARHRRWDRDVDAGDVVGAAILIGGIAAVASAFNNDGRGGSYGAERRAVDACVREAERGVSRYDRIRVRDITDVERRGGYYHVRGVMDVRGYFAGLDHGEAVASDSFTCTARGGRIYDFRRDGGYHW